MFGTESLRLLREVWPNATMLAQELYAIFQNTVPNLTGPMTVAANEGTPPLTLEGGTATVPWAQFKNEASNVPPVTFGPLGSGGAPVFTSPGGLWWQPTPEGPAQNLASGGGAGGGTIAAGGGGLPGKVKSGGPGQGPYKVTVYAAGPQAEGLDVDCLQLEIDSDDTVPAGAWVIVVVTGGKYYMQAPIWNPGSTQ